jgi:hypothetical protein
MFLKWSKEPVEGALAFFQPHLDKLKPTSFKYNNGGQKELLKSRIVITGKGRAEYYKAWVQFIRECYKFNGILTLLDVKDDDELKVHISMLIDDSCEVVAIGDSQPTLLEGVYALIVAQAGSTLFDGLQKVGKDLFVDKGNVYGAATVLVSTSSLAKSASVRSLSTPSPANLAKSSSVRSLSTPSPAKSSETPTSLLSDSPSGLR